MTTIRSYHLVSLLALVAGVLTLFLGLFFLWVLAPVVVICLFYLVFVFFEERRSLKNGAASRRGQRRLRLAAEAQAREHDLERPLA